MSLHYNEANSYLFVNGTAIHIFKAKDSEIVLNNLCLGNVSKDMKKHKKTGFNSHIYDSGFDYDAVGINDILDIHKCLMKKMTYIRCLDLLKGFFYNNDGFWL